LPIKSKHNGGIGWKQEHLDLGSTQCYLIDDLGGGVFKKRVNKNMHRSIILAKGGRYWIYEFLFAKKDRANISDDDLKDFRILAKGYAALSDKQIAKLLDDKDLTEICHDDEE
jgi:hypothetical protein